MKTYTDLLQSLKDQNYYTGIFFDPYIRLDFHNKGYLKITANKRPFKLVYFKEHDDYPEARKHEKWLKKKNREYKYKLTQLAPPVRGGVK